MILISVNPIPEGEEWRVNLLHDLLAMRSAKEYSFISEEEIQSMIEYVCTS